MYQRLIRLNMNVLVCITLSFMTMAGAMTSVRADWRETLEQARGQTVYWNAWGGDERINDYIAWVGEQVSARYDVTLKHIKINDAANVVASVLAEKSAGREQGGNVDLIWINGENFAAMKRNKLLQTDAWAEQLPNFRWVDVQGKPTVRLDFTVPTDGQESAWGMAQVVFMYDTASVAEPPRSMSALLDWAKAHPGRLSYPQPPDFLGTTFLKQALLELVADSTVLQRPADASDVAQVTAPLWAFLDQLHPHLWRQGRTFPSNGPAQRQLLGDGEIDFAISFTPGEASGAIAQGLLPDTIRTFVLAHGSLGNTHFVAIPFNATAVAGAQVVANFLLSPKAQVRKQDPRIWGDLTVLDINALQDSDQAAFAALDLGVATLTPAQLGATLPEPHPSWTEQLEQLWQARYASGQ